MARRAVPIDLAVLNCFLDFIGKENEPVNIILKDNESKTVRHTLSIIKSNLRGQFGPCFLHPFFLKFNKLWGNMFPLEGRLFDLKLARSRSSSAKQS